MNFKNHRQIILVVFVGFLVRLISADQSLWMDEAISGYAARDFSYSGIMNEFIRSDTHPPFYYLLLKFWTRIFGYSELSLRFPSILFGSITILFVYKIANSLSLKGVSKNFPLYSSLLTAFSPLLIYYSQEARMYSLSTFLACMIMWCYLRRKWFYLALSLFFLSITDYLPLLILIPLFLFTLLSKERRADLKKFIMSHILLFIFWLYWYPVFKYQSSESLEFLKNLPAFESILGFSNLKNMVLVWVKFLIGRINFKPKLLYGMVVFSVSVLTTLPLYNSIRNFRKTSLFWLWFTIPILLSFLISFNIPGFSYFRLIYVLPALLILLAYGFSVSRVGHGLFTLFLSSQILFTGIYLFNQDYWREDWKNAVPFIEKRVGKDEVVFISYPESFTPYEWYSEKDSKVVSFQKTNPADYNSLYSLDYLMDLTDPQKSNYKKLELLGFVNTETHNFRGVGQIRYWQR